MGTERYVKRILSAYPELEHSRFWKPREGYGNAFEPEPCVQRIREAFPEFADAGYRYIEGGDHHIILMNDRTAFRFVQDNEMKDIISLLREQAVLECLKPQLDVPVPNFTHRPESPDFAGYEWIHGANLTWDSFRGLSDAARADAARTFGTFLGTIHEFSVEQAIELGVEKERPRSARNTERHFYKRESKLEPEIHTMCKRWLPDIWAPDYTPTFIHCDVWHSHIYHDPQSGRITGIIDWGDICLMDPAYDLAGMWTYGEAFVDEVLTHYPRSDSTIKDRSLTHFKSTMLRGLLRRRGSNEFYLQILGDNWDL